MDNLHPSSPPRAALAIPGWSSALLALGLIWVCAAWTGFAAEDSATTGKPRQLTTPEPTPQGLAPADWASIWSTFKAGHSSIAQQAYLKAHRMDRDDRFGNSVAVSGDTVVVGAPWEDSGTTGINSTPDMAAPNAGAAYVFVRSGTNWSQQAYLKASQVTADDEFGYVVAVSGDTVVVGSHHEDSSTTGVNSTPDQAASDAGAAYMFVRRGTNWTQQAYLKASQVTAGADFGSAVAIVGDTAVVGAPGEASSTTGVNSTPDEKAPDTGAAYVFVRRGTNWTQQAYLKASQASQGDRFGISVAVDRETVVVGAYEEDSSTSGVNSTPDHAAKNAGAAYVFVGRGSNWTQQAYLKASQVTAGDCFGVSVAVSGDTVVVGAFWEDSNSTGVNSIPDTKAADSGAAYVFVRRGTNWTQQAYLKAHQVNAGDAFGHSVGVSGDTVVVGAGYEDSSTTGIDGAPNESAPNAGAAYVFVRRGTNWIQRAYLKAHQVTAGDEFGQSVAIDGDTVVVGAPWENQTTRTGAAYVFTGLGPSAFAVAATFAGTDWVPRGPTRPWRALASSRDGQRLVAAVDGGRLQVSADAGATWTARATERAWLAVASSADGSRLAAAVADGPLFRSADAGVTWSQCAPARKWSGLASSADGLRLAAVAEGGPILISTNAGGSWSTSERNRFWKGITSSADGQTLAAFVEDGPLLVSTDGGATWIPRGEAKAWTAVAATADGSVLVAAVWDGPIWVSPDSGLTWSERATDRFWHAVSCSADGRRMIAAETLGRSYLSYDSGLTWTERLENRDWASVAWSGDGERVFAVAREGPLFMSTSRVMPHRRVVSARAGRTSVPGLVPGFSPDPSDGQRLQLHWVVECADPDLFSSPPLLDRERNLIFVPAGRPGLARVTLTARDDGGSVIIEPQVIEIELQAP